MFDIFHSLEIGQYSDQIVHLPIINVQVAVDEYAKSYFRGNYPEEELAFGICRICSVVI